MPHAGSGLAIDVPSCSGEEMDGKVEVGEDGTSLGFEVCEAALVMVDCFGI